MYRLWEPRYDEIRRAFFKMGRYKPLPPQSAERQTISRVARFTQEDDEPRQLFYIPGFLEKRMFHYWGIHCALELPRQPEFFDTFDYVNDLAYQSKDTPTDWFAVLPWYMHVRAAIRFALYNSPVVHKPQLAFPLCIKPGAWEFLSTISSGLLKAAVLKSDKWRAPGTAKPQTQSYSFTMQIRQ